MLLKPWQLYILNIILLIIVGYNILPDFSLNKNDFVKVSGILSNAQIETVNDGRDREMLFNNLVRERLIINLSDRQLHEYYVTDINKEHWETLLSPDAIGQDIVLYLGKGKQQEDPFRIELNNKTVYDTDVRYYRNLIIILFTFALTLRNLFFYFKTEKEVVFDTQLKTVNQSFIGFLKRKAIGLRDYFLQ
ncbi:hypothetical protein [Lacinutrix chionoecetis]